MCAGIHPLTVSPVADQCELNGVPLVSTITPWETQFYGRGAQEGDAFETQLHLFWGFEQITNTFMSMWEGPRRRGRSWEASGPTIPTASGFAQGFTPVLEAAGYTVVDPGRYQNLTDDFTPIIRMFQERGVEIVTGVVLPPDWTTFWTQAAQQGFKVRAAYHGGGAHLSRHRGVARAPGAEPQLRPLLAPLLPLRQLPHGPERGRVRGRL